MKLNHLIIALISVQLGGCSVTLDDVPVADRRESIYTDIDLESLCTFIDPKRKHIYGEPAQLADAELQRRQANCGTNEPQESDTKNSFYAEKDSEALCALIDPRRVSEYGGPSQLADAELRRRGDSCKQNSVQVAINTVSEPLRSLGATPTSMVPQSRLPACSVISSYKHNCFGTRTYPPSGRKYVGDFKDDKYHGQGAYDFGNGYNYVGDYREGVQHGQGTLTWPNGDKYAGEFKDGWFHGKGVRTFASGRPPQEGIWENNEFVRAQRISDHIAGRASPAAPSVAQTRPPSAQATRQAEPPRSTLALSLSTSQPNSEGVVTINITTNSDTASLKIDGEEAGGRADGRYSVNRFAQIGSNSFEIIATDRYGNTKKQTVVVNREIQVVAERTRSLNPTLINAARPRDAVAIIIGIEKYKRVSDADFANRDASAFYDYARRALGIKPENIRLLVDDKADASEILRAFKTWLPTRVNKNTTDVYVFYSGHGLPSEDGGSLYFLPHEVDRDLLERTAITQKEVVQAIQRTTPKSVTMFIDSCYSGQSRTGTSLLASARPISIAPKASTDFPPNFMVISASAPDQISSSSPELKHGIFSYYLMLGMEGEADGNKDGQITVGEMQTYLSQQVTRRAIGMNRTQSPQTTGDLNRILVSSQNKAR
jgi:hypothetical protein